MSRGESKKIFRAGLHFGGLDYLYQRREALRLRCGSCCGRAPAGRAPLRRRAPPGRSSARLRAALRLRAGAGPGGRGSGRAAGRGGPFELWAFLDSVISYGAGPPGKIPEHAGKFFLGGGCISLNRVTIHPLRLRVNIDTRAAAKHAEKLFSGGGCIRRS